MQNFTMIMTMGNEAVVGTSCSSQRGHAVAPGKSHLLNTCGIESCVFFIHIYLDIFYTWQQIIRQAYRYCSCCSEIKHNIPYRDRPDLSPLRLEMRNSETFRSLFASFFAWDYITSWFQTRVLTLFRSLSFMGDVTFGKCQSLTRSLSAQQLPVLT
jgi:hypothetical protein